MQRRRALRRHRYSRTAGLRSGPVAQRRRRGRRPPGSEPLLRLYLRAGDEATPASLEDPRGYDGIAYGAEFCPRRLPEAAAAVAVARACAAAGRGFSLVTPIVRQGHLAFVQTYLEAFAAQAAGAECVCNDWGILQWLVDQQLPLRLAAGRLLSRQRRDPRVLLSMQQSARAEVLALRGSAWNDGDNLELLRALGVQRVELDFLLQGIAQFNLPQGMALSLCAPWLPVTVTPACDYTEHPLHCARSCREHPVVCRETTQDPHPLWSQGNTLFVRSVLHPPYPRLTKLGADRLVWAETLPG